MQHTHEASLYSIAIVTLTLTQLYNSINAKALATGLLSSCRVRGLQAWCEIVDS